MRTRPTNTTSKAWQAPNRHVHNALSLHVSESDSDWQEGETGAVCGSHNALSLHASHWQEGHKRRRGSAPFGVVNRLHDVRRTAAGHDARLTVGADTISTEHVCTGRDKDERDHATARRALTPMPQALLDACQGVLRAHVGRLHGCWRYRHVQTLCEQLQRFEDVLLLGLRQARSQIQPWFLLRGL